MGGLESRCIGHVYGADGAVYPSKNSVQKTICCNSTSNALDDGRMYPKHVKLGIYQSNYLVVSSWCSLYFIVYLASKKTPEMNTADVSQPKSTFVNANKQEIFCFS